MIFSIPRSKTFMDQFTYQKSNQYVQSKSGIKMARHTESPIKLTCYVNNSRELNASYSCSNSSPNTKFQEKLSNQMIHNRSRSNSKSYDKYLLQNKKKVQKQILLRNLSPDQKRIYQSSEQSRNIYSGKKLVDPIHQKFNYYIKNQIGNIKKQQKIPSVITDFLLQPCKINSKRIQSRPFTSQSFISSARETEMLESPKRPVKTRTNSTLARSYQNGWKQTNKSDMKNRIGENLIEFSTQFGLMGQNFPSKQFCVDPWELDPMSQNMESIKIH